MSSSGVSTLVKFLPFYPWPPIIGCMSQSSDLYRLQRIDTRRDQILNRIREIDQILQKDNSIRLAQENYNSSDKSHYEAVRALKRTEEAVQTQKIKIEQTESTLYGGLVRNPKELQDLQHESAALKKYVASLEDEQLEAMISLDAAQADLDTAAASLESAQKSFNQKQSGMLQEKEGLQKEIQKLDSERQAAASQIPAPNLGEYEKLRQQKRGLAVVAVVDHSCEGCGATLTPAEWQAARNPQQIGHCPSCGRILYAG